MEFNNTLLKFMVPIKQLQLEHQLQLAEQSHIIELHAGDELTANEESRWFLYLLEGRVDLLERNTSSYLLDNLDIRSRHPLFAEGEHITRLVAQTLSYVIRFDQQLFNTLLELELISGDDTQDVEMNEVEGMLFHEIMHAFNVGKLKLPCFPAIAKKVKAALSHPNLSAEDMAYIIAADPVITIRMISAANISLSTSGESVNSIREAIECLGLETSKQLLLNFTTTQLFASK